MKGVAPDTTLVLAGQAVRAFAYGLGAILLGRSLALLHPGGLWTGPALAATVAGTGLARVILARHGHSFGSRRSHAENP